MGFTVVGDAENGEDALEKLEQLEPEHIQNRHIRKKSVFSWKDISHESWRPTSGRPYRAYEYPSLPHLHSYKYTLRAEDKYYIITYIKRHI